MTDEVFKRSLSALTIVAVLLVVAFLVTGWLGAFWAVVVGLFVETIGGGALVFFWGKDYMSRV